MIDGRIEKIENIDRVCSEFEDQYVELTIKIRDRFAPCRPYWRYSPYERDAWVVKDEDLKDPHFLESMDKWLEDMSHYYTEVEDAAYQREAVGRLHLGKIKIIQENE